MVETKLEALRRCEDVLKLNAWKRLRAGAGLKTIRDEELYLDDFKSFVAYCRNQDLPIPEARQMIHDSEVASVALASQPDGGSLTDLEGGET